MTKADEQGVRARWSSSWLAIPSFPVGLVFTDFRPILGLWLGAGAALVAAVAFAWSRVPRWLAWFAAGLALGVVALYLLAWLQLGSPDSGSGSGSGTASSR